jgi:hypothetical protein
MANLNTKAAQLETMLLLHFSTLDLADSNIHETYPFPPRTITAPTPFHSVLNRPTFRLLSYYKYDQTLRQLHVCAPSISRPPFCLGFKPTPFYFAPIRLHVVPITRLLFFDSL